MDAEAICAASDELLVDLGLDAKGDICALKSFCCNSGVASKVTDSDTKFKKGENSREDRKRKLLAILEAGKKTRLKQKKTTEENPKVPVVREKTRRVQLGWLHFDRKQNRYVPVRTSRGGGTRNIDFPSNAKKDQVMQASINIFFENGQSTFGSSTDMQFNIANFKMNQIDTLKDENGKEDKFSIQGYFDCYKLSKARVYLMSKGMEIGNVDKPQLRPEETSKDKNQELTDSEMDPEVSRVK